MFEYIKRNHSVLNLNKKKAQYTYYAKCSQPYAPYAVQVFVRFNGELQRQSFEFYVFTMMHRLSNGALCEPNLCISI